MFHVKHFKVLLYFKNIESDKFKRRKSFRVRATVKCILILCDDVFFLVVGWGMLTFIVWQSFRCYLLLYDNNFKITAFIAWRERRARCEKDQWVWLLQFIYEGKSNIIYTFAITEEERHIVGSGAINTTVP